MAKIFVMLNLLKNFQPSGKVIGFYVEDNLLPNSYSLRQAYCYLKSNRFTFTVQLKSLIVSILHD